MPCGDLPIEGKILVITGGGSGINFCFVQAALKLSPKGIIVADLRLNDEAEKFFNEHKGTTELVFAKTDVAKRADLENLVTVSKDKFNDVPDIYIAGAAVFEPPWSNWWDDTEEDDYAELKININHPLKLARIAMRALLSHGKRGVILILASTGGYTGLFTAPLYCSSKHAVIGFVRSMPPVDVYENIKVVAVAPGVVNTPLWTARPELMKQWGYDENRAIEPETVAQRMIELVTDGQYVGGTCMEITVAGVRTLGEWNIAQSVYSSSPRPPEVLANMHAPVRALMEKEKQLGQ